MSSEFERIAILARRFAAPARGWVVGIGDDAAVLSPSPLPLVWTIDAQIDGTHFRLDWLAWEDVGWRSFMAAASDLAAMGATPLAALSALTLTTSVDDLSLDALTEGQANAARAVGAAIIGGNLARGTETSVTTTLLGEVAKPVLRDGARAGDGLFLAGRVGDAAAGLLAVSTGRITTETETCVTTWRRPVALVAEGLAMRDLASSAIDVSDGLSQDAGHIAEASGVTLVFDEALLRARASRFLVTAGAALGRDVLDLMLTGGEDYALLVTSRAEAIPGFDRIGSVEGAATTGKGVVLQQKDGTRAPIAARGFDHFARPASEEG